AEVDRGGEGLHVVVGQLLPQPGRRPAEEHQEDAGVGEQDQPEEGEPAEAEGVGQLQPVPLHLHRVQVVQHVVHHRQRPVPGGVAVPGPVDRPGPEDRLPDLRVPGLLPELARLWRLGRPKLQRHTSLLVDETHLSNRTYPLAALPSPPRAYHSAPVGQRSMQMPQRTHSLSSITNRACDVWARVVTSWLWPSATMSGASMWMKSQGQSPRQA